jgi:hypothetical protein
MNPESPPEPCVRAAQPYKSHGGRRYAMGT